MNTEWFECKVKYDKPLDSESLKTKTVTETYLVDALSFTEAEKRFIDEITPFMSGEFLVSNIRRIKLSELFESENTQADKWFKVKVAFITLDEKSGEEKYTIGFMLVQATDFKDALRQFDKNMAGTLGDFKIISMTETPIMDIYRYEPQD